MTIDEAINFAARAHAGQMRKGTSLPYITHPFGVALLLACAGATETQIIAGLLHDTVEDTDTTIAEIGQHFGSAVAQIVADCTESDKHLPWETRKRHTLEQLPGLPDSSLLVILADKLHNIRTIAAAQAECGERVWQRFNRPREVQQWYYRQLVIVFSQLEYTRQHPFFTAFRETVARVLGGAQSTETEVTER